MVTRSGGLVMSALIGAIVLTPRSSGAQTRASATAVVTAVIVPAIAVKSSEGINFGVLERNSGIRKTPLYSDRVAPFTITGQPESLINITLPGIVMLHNTTGNALAFSPEVPTWHTDDASPEPPRPFPDKTGGTASFGKKGTLNVWLGGAINTNRAAEGSYNGKYTITITY